QELTKMFGEEAFKAVGDLANAQLKKAIKDKDQESIQRWGKGGSYRVALHAMVGGMMADLGGGNVISGALGAGVSEASRKALSKLSPDLQQWASMAIGGAASKISGGGIQTGASTALSGTRNNYFTHQLQEDFAEDLKNATTKEDQIAVIKEYL
ncbi:adhesin HecA family protein, partial [Acetonema longum DSM 6540]